MLFTEWTLCMIACRLSEHTTELQNSYVRQVGFSRKGCAWYYSLFNMHPDTDQQEVNSSESLSRRLYLEIERDSK